jgi:dTDP-4-amino-4,6-dideoxygalactose transaminase
MTKNKKIWLSPPHMGGEELSYIVDAFETNWIAPLGLHVNAFEKDLATYCGTTGATVLNSGTAAIHLALIELGVGPGDLVICQSFTFSASANPIVYLGAKPVFVDSEMETWNMCPVLLEEAIKGCISKHGKLPKAIIPVHLYGMPAKMNQIVKISNEYGVPIIEDAAESLGSKYHGKSCGSFGDYGILSFNGNKIITTSGGGAVLSNNLKSLDRIRYLATQARDDAPHYQHSEIGYNYRMSNILAGIGRGQLGVLDQRVQKRREVFDFYKKNLNGIEGLSFLDEPDGHYSNRWLTTILVDSDKCGIHREDIRLKLEENIIESRPLWKPMHQQPVFAGSDFYGDGYSNKLFESGLCLPSGSSLTQNDLNRIVEIILSLFR